MMRASRLAVLGFVFAAFGVGTAPAVADDPGYAKLKALIDGPQRSERNRVRDPYRHPLETLTFFGLRDNMRVVEIWPGANGYWLEILAPYLKNSGTYYAAGPEKTTTSEELQHDISGLAAKITNDSNVYGKVVVTEFAGDKYDIAPPGSADMVLTFRNLHNWVKNGEADAALRAFHKALKVGGILGVEGHRGRNDQPQDPQAKSGYLREDFAIALVEKAGFKLVEKSEANANPKDTKDYPEGVWTLPPTYRLKDQDRAKYAAIGETDRFTLKFVKVAP